MPRLDRGFVLILDSWLLSLLSILLSTWSGSYLIYKQIVFGWGDDSSFFCHAALFWLRVHFEQNCIWPMITDEDLQDVFLKHRCPLQHQSPNKAKILHFYPAQHLWVQEVNNV